MKMTVYVKGVLVEFDSPYDNVTAHAKLVAMCRPGGRLQRSEFAHSLALLNPNRMSEGRVNWMHKLVVDGEKPPAPPPEPLKENLLGVVNLFDKAVQGKLKRPKITMSVVFNDVPFNVELSRTGAGSKYGEGCVYVTDGGGFGNSTWYARINREGEVTVSRHINDAIRLLLARMSIDPAKVARDYGIKTGRCCFCNKGLELEKSVAAGFGMVCSKKWGLYEQWKTAERTAAAAAGV